MLTGEAYTIDNTPFITQGHYYVVSVAGSTSLNGISDWVIGDWVIAGATNVWEKLDGTAVQGTGTDNYLTKWNGTGVSSIVDSGVTDDGSTIKLLDDVELGASATDTTLVKGPATFEENTRFDKSISIGAAYGSSGDVFTSGGGAGSVNTWTTPTTGTVEEVDSGAGLITSPVAGITTTGSVAIDYLGGDNAILSATIAAEPILATDHIWFNDVATLSPVATVNKVKYATISSLPFNSYLWKLDADSIGSANVTNNEEVDFVGTNGITITKAYADPLHTVTIQGVSNPVTGTGTQYTLPVWDTTTSLSDSMVYQNAATGTILTIESAAPTLKLKNSTALAGQLTILCGTDTQTFTSTGIQDTTAGNTSTFGGYVFNRQKVITDGATTTNAIMTLTATGNAIFAGNVGVAGKTPTYGLNLAQGTAAGNKIAWTDGTPNFRGSIYADSSNDKFTIATPSVTSVENSCFRNRHITKLNFFRKCNC